MQKLISKKTFLKLLIAFIIAILGQAMVINPTYADCQDGYAETTVLGCVETKDGCGLFMAINITLTVITSGATVLGILGIVISGIMYASARDNEAQVAKAKKRILEVVIGLALWTFLYIISQFLLPGGFANNNQTCNIIPPMTAAEIRARNNEINKKSNDAMLKQLQSNKSDDKDNKSKDDTVQKAGKGTEAKRKAIKDAAYKMSKKDAKAPQTPNEAYRKTAKAVGVTRRNGKCCGCFASTVIRSTGAGGSNVPTNSHDLHQYLERHSDKWQKVSGTKKCQPGDIMMQVEKGKKWARHSAVVVEKNGKKAQAEASVASGSSRGFYPRVVSGLHTYGRNIYCYRYIGN